MNRPAKTLLWLAAAAALPGAHLGAQDLLVTARRIVVAPDTVLENGSLLVRQGKIAYVGSDIPAEARARARAVDYGDATIVPGFVLAYAILGQDADLAENAFPFTPDLLAAEGFDAWHEEFARLPGTGVTAAAMSPSERQVAGGIAALVKPTKDGATLAAAELHLSLSLTRAARDQERPPTSMMGALDMLRTGFRDAGGGVQTGADLAVLRQVLQGSRRVFVRADSQREIAAALDLAKEFGFEPVLVGAAEAREVLPRIAQQKASVVLGGLVPEARIAQLELPAALAKAGIAFSFSGQPEQLRLTAALAVRHGLERNLALAALTRTPALQLGLAERVGALRQGCDADFAVFTGDPVDLGSRHVATWIGGVRQHGDEPGKKPSNPNAATAAVGAGR